MVVFGHIGCIWAKVFVFGQVGGIWAKLVVFWQIGFIWSKVVLTGKKVFVIWPKWLYLGKLVLFG